MVDKSELAIAASQTQNRIIFKLNYYSTYCLKWLLYLSTIKLTCHPV